jgi:hypothetical protein
MFAHPNTPERKITERESKRKAAGFAMRLTVLYRSSNMLGKQKPIFLGGMSMSYVYRIRVKSQLSSYWEDWLGGMALTNLENGEAELEGLLEDQEALHRILEKIRDLNIALISIEQTDGLPEQDGGRNG